MAVDFYFEPATISVRSRAQLRVEWANIPNDESREIIIVEHQFLIFQHSLLKKLMFTEAGKIDNPTYTGHLMGGLRVGAIKAAILVAASIAEEALLAHAIERGYELAEEENERTFGNIIKAWRANNWQDIDKRESCRIQWLNNERNNIHLHKVLSKHTHPEEFYDDVIEKENKYVERMISVISAMKILVS